ncbi:MAG: putative addiction module antidote protein [Parasphingorhabdus sp.]|jgi:probable addiction module antidote protein
MFLNIFVRRKKWRLTWTRQLQKAKESGPGRESLYKALSAEGNPQLSTVLKVAKALGLAFNVKPAK